MKKTILLALKLLILPIALFTESSFAGFVAEEAICTQTSTGGYCRGTLKGFRDDSRDQSYATFRKIRSSSGNYSYSFFAQLNNQSYYCLASSTNAKYMWDEIYAGNWFYISWNSGKYCTVVESQKASHTEG